MFTVALKAEYPILAIAVRSQIGSIRSTISEEMRCMMGKATWAEVDVKRVPRCW
jgi:hypothetical protein